MVFSFRIVVKLRLVQPTHRVMRLCAVRLFIQDAFIFLKCLGIMIVLNVCLGFQIQLFRVCVHSLWYYYHPNTHAKINGATMVASLSTINFGVWISSLPHVIFSFGTAPEYDP